MFERTAPGAPLSARSNGDGPRHTYNDVRGAPGVRYTRRKSRGTICGEAPFHVHRNKAQPVICNIAHPHRRKKSQSCADASVRAQTVLSKRVPTAQTSTRCNGAGFEVDLPHMNCLNQKAENGGETKMHLHLHQGQPILCNLPHTHLQTQPQPSQRSCTPSLENETSASSLDIGSNPIPAKLDEGEVVPGQGDAQMHTHVCERQRMLCNVSETHLRTQTQSYGVTSTKSQSSHQTCTTSAHMGASATTTSNDVPREEIKARNDQKLTSAAERRSCGNKNMRKCSATSGACDTIHTHQIDKPKPQSTHINPEIPTQSYRPGERVVLLPNLLRVDHDLSEVQRQHRLSNYSSSLIEQAEKLHDQTLRLYGIALRLHGYALAQQDLASSKPPKRVRCSNARNRTPRGHVSSTLRYEHDTANPLENQSGDSNCRENIRYDEGRRFSSKQVRSKSQFNRVARSFSSVMGCNHQTDARDRGRSRGPIRSSYATNDILRGIIEHKNESTSNTRCDDTTADPSDDIASLDPLWGSQPSGLIREGPDYCCVDDAIGTSSDSDSMPIAIPFVAEDVLNHLRTVRKSAAGDASDANSSNSDLRSIQYQNQSVEPLNHSYLSTEGDPILLDKSLKSASTTDTHGSEHDNNITEVHERTGDSVCVSSDDAANIESPKDPSPFTLQSSNPEFTAARPIEIPHRVWDRKRIHVQTTDVNVAAELQTRREGSHVSTTSLSSLEQECFEP